MFTDCDVYVMRKNAWKYFERECNGADYWITVMEDACSDLKIDTHETLRGQISNCYGREVTEGMMETRFINPNFPVAGKAPQFLELIISANELRLETEKVRLKERSSTTICDMVCDRSCIFYLDQLIVFKRQISLMLSGRTGT